MSDLTLKDLEQASDLTILAKASKKELLSIISDMFEITKVGDVCCGDMETQDKVFNAIYCELISRF